MMTKTQISGREGNQMAQQYFPLVCKIAGQLSKASGYDLDECKSAGNIGLIKAMETYDPSKGEKKQTFIQYAAYIIRGYILNDINKHSHLIRVNPDQQKKLREAGESINKTVSIDKSMGCTDDGDACTLANIIPGDTSAEIYASIDPSVDNIWNTIYSRLNTIFSERDLDIFYSTFGVNGREEINGKDMALKYSISQGAVTQVRNKIVKYMKKDRPLREMLLNILQINNESYAF